MKISRRELRKIIAEVTRYTTREVGDPGESVGVEELQIGSLMPSTREVITKHNINLNNNAWSASGDDDNEIVAVRDTNSDTVLVYFRGKLAMSASPSDSVLVDDAGNTFHNAVEIWLRSSQYGSFPKSNTMKLVKGMLKILRGRIDNASAVSRPGLMSQDTRDFYEYASNVSGPNLTALTISGRLKM
jgi:hypothetical protein